MEQLAATYSRSRDASLPDIEASIVSRTLDANQWTALTSQQNVPGFLLLDSIRLYKKATTTQNQFAPAVVALRKESDDTRQRMDTIIQDIQTYRERLGKVEHNVQQVSKDLNNLDQQVDTVRRDNLRTDGATTRNGQDVSQLAEKFTVLERELRSLRAREEDTQGRLAEMRTLVAEYLAMFASLEARGLSLVQKTQPTIAVESLFPPPEGERGEPRKTLVNGSVTRRDEAQPAHLTSDHVFNHSQPPRALGDGLRGTRPAVTYQKYPEAHSRRQVVNGLSSSSGFEPQASAVEHHAALQPQMQRSTSPASGDETVSEMSEADTDSEAPGGDTTTPRPPKPCHAALMKLLKQAVDKHSEHANLPDNKRIWAFMDTIGDYQLSKRLQMFLLDRFDHRLVSRSHASAREIAKRNRFITVSKLKWPLFARGVAEFLKKSDAQVR